MIIFACTEFIMVFFVSHKMLEMVLHSLGIFIIKERVDSKYSVNTLLAPYQNGLGLKYGLTKLLIVRRKCTLALSIH